MSIAACARILRKGDPDRFLATMAAPPAARPALFAIFAFNVEVARAPWVTQEPMIAEMRLQWWRDALEEIGQGAPVRKHEVTTPLAGVLDAQGAALLDRLVAARRWDIYKDPFEDAADFTGYLEETGGNLMLAAARALVPATAPGAPDGPFTARETAAIRSVGYAAGLANWLRAVPELEARGRIPLVDGRPQAVADLARTGLLRLAEGRREVPKTARPATRSGWLADRTLRSAAATPANVAEGRLHIPEFYRRGALLRRVLTGAP